MRVCMFSDPHGRLPESLPESDVIIIAGDLAPIVDHSLVFQKSWFEYDFVNWVDKQDVPVVFIAGNHDFLPQSDENFGWKISERCSAFYLQDEQFICPPPYGVKIWGSPWSLNFGPWAFMTSERGIRQQLKDVPNDTDIIVSHTPPFRKRDKTTRGKYNGSKFLGARIREVAPQLVVCGHIHEAYGTAFEGDTMIVNCSIMNERYDPVNPPVVVDLPLR